MNKDTKELLKLGDEQLNKLKKIVEQAIAEEKLIVENFLHQSKEILNRGQNISDKVASFGGSWKFIILFFFYFILDTI